MQHIRMLLGIMVWIVGVPTLATFSSFILRVPTEAATVPRGLEVVRFLQEQISPAPWSRTNLHPLMSVRTYRLLFPDQVQRRADLRGDQTCRRHSSLACQEVEGCTCIGLQRRGEGWMSSRVERMFLSFTSDCCARGGRTLYYRGTPGCIYRVLNLHGDAFLLEHGEHRGIDSFNLCTCAQHQNLCTGKRK